MFLKVFKFEVRDTWVIKLHPGVLISADPLGVTLFLFSASVGVDIRPVVTHVSRSGVHVDTNELVLEAVFALRLLSLLFCFATLFQFLFGEGILFFFFLQCIRYWIFTVLLLLFESVFFAHDFKEAVRLQVEDPWELA